MIIPGFGMISHVISTFSGKPVFGYLGMIYAIASIGILGFIVWSQNVVALLSCEGQVTNLAICWNSSVFIGTFMCKNSISYTQSAGNPGTFRSLTSSSETTCETSFNFTTFNNLYTRLTHQPSLDTHWLTWFVGFAEGDGAILTSGSRPRFVLTQKESTVLFMIRDTFGFGMVRYFEKGNFYRFIVEDNANVRLLAHLFNGNLVISRRITQLQAWLNVLGDIQLISIPVIPTLKDAWLSGFTDAEGCFNVNITKRADTVTGFRVIIRFLLDQKNEEELLFYIKTLLGFGSVNLRKDTNMVFRYTLNSFKGLVTVRDYFVFFPLKTKKSASFEKWCEVYSMVLNKQHLTNEGLAVIRVIAKQINVVNSETGPTGSARL